VTKPTICYKIIFV